MAVYHGSAIGGARPKALIESDDRKYIAKFSSTADLYSVVKAEFIAMRLARLGSVDKKLFWKRQFLNPYAFNN